MTPTELAELHRLLRKFNETYDLPKNLGITPADTRERMDEYINQKRREARTRRSSDTRTRRHLQSV